MALGELDGLPLFHQKTIPFILTNASKYNKNPTHTLTLQVSAHALSVHLLLTAIYTSAGKRGTDKNL